MIRLRIGMAAALAALGAPAGAQEAVSAEFGYRSLDLATLGLGDGVEAYAIETVVVVAAGSGPLAGLRGRCILAGTRDAGHAAEGRCALSDGAGDRLLLDLSERSVPGQAPEGEGRWTGGTGRFADARGAFTYRLMSYALRPEGVMEGVGRLDGDLALATPPPAEPPEAPFRLIIPEAP